MNLVFHIHCQVSVEGNFQKTDVVDWHLLISLPLLFSFLTMISPTLWKHEWFIKWILWMYIDESSSLRSRCFLLSMCRYCHPVETNVTEAITLFILFVDLSAKSSDWIVSSAVVSLIFAEFTNPSDQMMKVAPADAWAKTMMRWYLNMIERKISKKTLAKHSIIGIMVIWLTFKNICKLCTNFSASNRRRNVWYKRRTKDAMQTLYGLLSTPEPQTLTLGCRDHSCSGRSACKRRCRWRNHHGYACRVWWTNCWYWWLIGRWQFWSCPLGDALGLSKGGNVAGALLSPYGTSSLLCMRLLQRLPIRDKAEVEFLCRIKRMPS